MKIIALIPAHNEAPGNHIPPGYGYYGRHIQYVRRLKLVDEAIWKALDGKLIEEDKLLSGLIRSQKR